MNIINKILVLSSLAFVCSCSNKDELLPETDQNNMQESEYPIQLNGGAVASTRAAIMGNGSEGIPGIAVWCLAKDVMQENLDPQGIKWFGSAPENETCCIMKNVKSSIVGGSVRWDNANDRYFYPVTQFYRYEFYANYPYTTDLTYTETSVQARYTIDGTQDLLWGRATSEADYAWSAKYFRVNGGQTAGNRPNLKMEHMLTRKCHQRLAPLSNTVIHFLHLEEQRSFSSISINWSVYGAIVLNTLCAVKDLTGIISDE